MKKFRLVVGVAAVLAVAFAVVPAALRTQHAGAAVHGLSVHGMNKIQRHILSGFASFEANIGVSSRPAGAPTGARPKRPNPPPLPGNNRPRAVGHHNRPNPYPPAPHSPR